MPTLIAIEASAFPVFPFHGLPLQSRAIRPLTVTPILVLLACIKRSESLRFRRRGDLIERRILMPLIRLNEKAFSAGLAGVVFLMTDGSRTVNCWITYPALQDQTPGLTIAG